MNFFTIGPGDSNERFLLFENYHFPNIMRQKYQKTDFWPFTDIFSRAITHSKIDRFSWFFFLQTQKMPRNIFCYFRYIEICILIFSLFLHWRPSWIFIKNDLLFKYIDCVFGYFFIFNPQELVYQRRHLHHNLKSNAIFMHLATLLSWIFRHKHFKLEKGSKHK